MSLVPLTPVKDKQTGRERRPVNEHERGKLRREKEKADYRNRNGYAPR